MRTSLNRISAIIFVAMILAALVFGSLPPDRVLAADQILGGSAVEGYLRITSKDNGQIGVERYSSGAWQRQIYAIYSKGSVVYYNGTKYAMGYFSPTAATPVSNYRSGNSIYSSWTAGSLTINRTLTYNDGDAYFRLDWSIYNSSSSYYSDVRFLHGEDTYLKGGDNGAGWWDGTNSTIGVRKTISGVEQRMSLQGITTPYAYQSNNYSSVYSAVSAGALTNAIDPNESTDNGYALEWRTSLGGYSTWSITAYEKFIAGAIGALQVVAPTAVDCAAGTTCSLNFTVRNPTGSALGATLSLSNTLGWSAWLTGSSSISVPANSSVSVGVSVTAGTGGTTSYVSLTATPSTGQSSTDRAAVNSTVPPNSPPYAFSLSGTSVYENQSAGTTVGTITSGGDPNGDPVSFSLTSGATSSFYLSGTTLKTNAVFNYESQTSYSLGITASDGRGGTTAQSYTISILNQNEAPTLAQPSTQTVNEDSSVTFSMTASDPDGLTSRLTWSVLSSPSNGNVSGISGTGGSKSVTYTPAANFNGSDSFQVRVTGEGNLTSDRTVSVTVNAVNDTPTLSVPGAQTTRVNQPWSFGPLTSTHINNPITVADIDAGSADVQLSLTATNGTLTVPNRTGLTFSTGTGTGGEAALVYRGSLTNVNNSLNGLIFTPTSSYSGSGALALTLSDLGNTGSGGTLTASGTVNFTIANPSTLYVDPNYTSSTTGWGYDRFPKIQDAIDASAGFTPGISVAAATYSENVNLNQPVTITPAGNVQISGNLTLAAGTWNAGSTTLTLTGNLTLSGGTFSKGSGSVTFTGGGVHLFSGTTTLNNITIASSNTLRLADNANLGYAGTMSNSGTFDGTTAAHSTLTLSGSSSQALPSGTFSVHSLVINNTAGVSAPQAIAVVDTLNVQAGQFSPYTGSTVCNLVIASGATLYAPSALTVTCNWDNQGTFTHNNGTVTFAGSSAQTLSGNASQTFGHLVVNNAAGVSAAGLTTLNATDLAINAGTFTAPANLNLNLTVGSSGTLSAVTLALTGTLNNQGTVSVTTSLTQNGAVTNSGTFNAAPTTSITGALANTGTVNAGSSFDLTGNLTNSSSGIINAGASFSMTGDLTNSNTAVFNAGATVNLTGSLTNSASYIASTSTSVSSNFSNSGTYTAGAGLTLGGNFTNNGTFNANGGLVTISGGTSHSFSGTAVFHNLAVDNTALVLTNNANLGYSGTFTLPNGGSFDPLTNSNTTVTLAGSSAQVLPSGVSTLENLVINSGATLTAPAVLNIRNNFTNNGTFNHNSGTVNFTGSGAQAFTGSGATHFYDLNINNSAATPSDAVDVDFDASFDVARNLTLVDGQFQPSACFAAVNLTINANGILKPDGAACLSVSGNWDNQGTFTANGSTVTFNGSGAQEIIGTNNIFYNLTVNNSAEFPGDDVDVDPRSPITVTNTLTVSGGQFQPESGSTFKNVTITTGTLRPEAGGYFNVTGDWTRATNGWFEANSGTVIFNGSGAQAISGGTSFYDLTIANSGGLTDSTDVDPDVAITVDRNLVVQSGQFQPPSNSKFRNVEIQSGAQLKPDGNITISGNLTNAVGGSYVHNNRAVTIDGSGIQEMTGSIDFYNLTINSGSTLRLMNNANLGYAGAFTLAGTQPNRGVLDATTAAHTTVTVKGTQPQSLPNDMYLHDLVINTGSTLNAPALLSLTGDFTRLGTFNHQDGLITFNGTTAQVISGSTTFKNIKVANSTLLGIASGSTLTLAGTMTQSESGALDASGTNSSVVIAGTGTGHALPAGSKVHHLVIQSTLDAPAGDLTLTGDWTNSGTFVANGGRVIFDGSTAQSITGANLTSFYDLTVSSSVGVSTTRSLAVSNLLKVEDSNFQVSAGTDLHSVQIVASGTLTPAGALTVSGDWTQAGTFTKGTHTVTFDGSAGQSITGGNFYNLTIQNTASTPATGPVITLDAVTVSALLNVTDGQFEPYCGSQLASVSIGADGILKLPGDTTACPAGVTVSGSWTNNGTLDANSGLVTLNGTSTQTVGGTSSNAFANLKITNTGSVVTSGTFSLTSDLNVAAGSLTVADSAAFVNVIIANNATLVGPSAGSFSLTGYWQDNNTAATGGFTASGSKVTFTGSGEHSFSGNSTFHDLEVASSNTLKAAANADLGLSGTLTLPVPGALDLTTNSGVTLSVSSPDTGPLPSGMTLNHLVLHAPADFHAPDALTLNGNLLIDSGAIYLAPADASTLTIKGNWTNNGSFTEGTASVVNFSGTGAQAIAGSSETNFVTLNLTDGGTLTSSRSLKATSALNVTNGNFTPGTGSQFGDVTIASGATLNGSNGTILVSGQWLNSGTFTTGTGKVTLNGSGAQSIMQPSPQVFYDLEIGSGTRAVNTTVATVKYPVTINRNLVVRAETFSPDCGSAFTNVRIEVGGQLNIPGSCTPPAITINGTWANYGTVSINGATVGGVFTVLTTYVSPDYSPFVSDVNPGTPGFGLDHFSRFNNVASPAAPEDYGAVDKTEPGGTLFVAAGKTYSEATITIDKAITVQLDGNAIFDHNLVISAAATLDASRAATFTINGNYNQSAGTMNAPAAGTLAIAGSLTQSSGTLDASGATTLTVGSGFGQSAGTFKAPATVTLPATQPSMTITGDLALSGGTLDASGAASLTVTGNYAQTAPTVSSTFKAPAAGGASAWMDVQGNFTLTAPAGPEGTETKFTNSAGNLKVAGDFTQPTGTLFSGSGSTPIGTVTLYGAADPQALSAAATIYNLTIDKSDSTKIVQASSPITVSNLLTVNNGVYKATNSSSFANLTLNSGTGTLGTLEVPVRIGGTGEEISHVDVPGLFTNNGMLVFTSPTGGEFIGRLHATLTTVYVDDGYTAATSGFGFDHVQSLSDGITKVSDGGRVIVYAGDYSTEDVVVPASRNLTIALDGTSGAVVQVKSLTVNDGAVTFSADASGSSPATSFSGTLQVAAGLTLASGKTFNPAGGTVEFNGAAAQALTGSFIFDTLKISNTGIPADVQVTTGSPVTVTGLLNLADGRFMPACSSSFHDVTIAQDGSLAFATACSTSVSGDWTDAHSESPSTGLISGGGTVSFNGGSTQLYSGKTVFGNVSVGSSTTLQLANAANLNLTGNLQVAAGPVPPAGSFDAQTNALSPSSNTVTMMGSAPSQTLPSGLTFDNLVIQSGATVTGPALLNLVGNWTNDGTFNPGSGTLAFTGSEDQILGGATNPQTFYNLVLDKPVANKDKKVTVNQIVTLSNDLTITSGSLVMLAGGNVTPIPNTAVNASVAGNGTLVMGSTIPSLHSDMALSGSWNSSGTYNPVNGAVVPAHVSALYVDPNYNGSTPGFGIDRFDSLVTALASPALVTDAVVTVYPGTYLDDPADVASMTAATPVTVNFTGDASAVFVLPGSLVLDGGTFNAPLGTLKLGSNLTRSAGVFNANGGTLELNGASAQAVSGSFTGTNKFNHLTLNNSAGAALDAAAEIGATLKSTAGTLTLVTGSTLKDVTLNGGTLTTAASGAALTVNGSWTRTSGSFAANGSTVTFAGAASTVHNLSGTVNFANLTVNTANTLALADGANLGLSGTLSMNGSLDARPSGGHTTLTLNSASTQSLPSGLNLDHLVVSAGTNLTAPAALNLSGSLTNDGTFTAGSGTLTLSGDLTSSGTFAAGSGTVTFNGSDAQAVSPAVNFYHLNKSGAGTLTPTYPMTVGGNLVIDGGTFDASGALELHGGLTLTSGTFAAGAGTLTLKGSATQNITGSFTGASQLNHLTLSNASGAAFASALGVGGTLTTSSGTLIVVTGSTVKDVALNGGTLTTAASGAALSVSGNWSATSGSFAANGSTVSFTGPAATEHSLSGTVNFANLTIATDNTLKLANNANLGLAGALVADGSLDARPVGGRTTLTINGGAAQSLPSGLSLDHLVITGTNTAFTAPAALALSGDLTNNAAFTHGGGTLTLNGSGAQTIGGANAIPFNNLVINNSTPASIVAASPAPSVAGTLTLTSGTFRPASGADLHEVAIAADGAFDAPAGQVTVSGDWNDLGAFNANGGTLKFDGAADQAVAESDPFAALTVATAAGKKVSTSPAVTVTGTLTVTQGTFAPYTASAFGHVSIADGAALDGQSISLTVGGDWTNASTTHAGYLSDGTSALDFTGSGTHAFSGETTFNNIGLGTGTLQQANGSHLILAGTMTAGAGGTLTMTAAPGADATLTLAASGAQTLPSGLALHNLVIGAATDFTAPAALGVSGDLTLTAGGSFTDGAGTLTFNGSGAQAISGTFTFKNLTVNNTAASPSDAVDVDPDHLVTVTGLLKVSDGQFQPPACSDFVDITIEPNGILKPDGTGACGSKLYISGNWANTGTFTPGTTAVVFDGAAAQTITGTTAFYDLVIENTSGGVDATGSTLAVTHDLTLTSGTLETPPAADLHNVTIGVNGTLDGSAGDLTVSGSWTDQHIEDPSTGFVPGTNKVTFDGAGPHAYSGNTAFNDLTLQSGAFTASTAMTVAGSLAVDGGSFSPADGSTFMDIAIGASGTFNAPAGDLNLKGDLAVASGGTFNPGTSGTIHLNGTGAQTISGVTPFYNLSIENVAGVDATGSTLSVANNLAVTDGTLQTPANADLNNVTIATNGTLDGSAGNLTVSGNWTDNHVGGGFVAGSDPNQVTFDGSGTHTYSGTSTFNNLVVSGSMLQPAADSVLGLTGDLSLTGGTLDTAAHQPNTLSFTGSGSHTIPTGLTLDNLVIGSGSTLLGPANLTVTGNWTNNGGFTPGDGTVTFNGGSTQTIGGSTTPANFNNLIVSGAGTNVDPNIALQLGGTLTVNSGTVQIPTGSSLNNVTVASGGTLTLDPDATISLNGTWTNNGTVNTNNGTVTTDPGTTQITTVYVDSAYTSATSGWGIDRFKVIQSGFNRIAAGGTVTIYGGSYTEDVTLSTSATVLMLPSLEGSLIADVTLTGSLDLQHGTITGPAGALKISGNLTLATGATYTANNGTLVMNGGGPQAIDGALTFYKLVILNTDTAPADDHAVSSTQITVTNLLDVQDGQFMPACHSDFVDVTIGADGILKPQGGTCSVPGWTVSGNWINNGSFLANGSLVTFDGEADQTIGGSQTTTFANLTINSPTESTVDANSVVNVTGVLSVEAGRFMPTTGSTIHDLSLGEFGVVLPDTSAVLNITGNVDNLGRFTPNGETVVFKGSGPQTISGAISFNNLTIDKTPATDTLDAGLGVRVVNLLDLTSGTFLVPTGSVFKDVTLGANGEMTLDSGAVVQISGNSSNDGKLSADGATLTVGGDVTNGGSISANSGSLTITGCLFNTGTASANGGTLAVGGCLTNSGDLSVNSGTLTVGGSVSNTGTLSATSASVAVTGDVTNTGTITATSATLTIIGSLANNSSGVFHADTGASLTVGGSLTNHAEFSVNNGTLKIGGDLTNDGTQFGVTQTGVTFNGSGSQNVTGTFTFYDLTIANTAASPSDSVDVNFNSPVTVTHNTTVSDGQFQPLAGSSFNNLAIDLNGIFKPAPSGNAIITITGDFSNLGLLQANGVTIEGGRFSNVKVSAAYNENTPGYGYDRFSSINAAIAKVIETGHVQIYAGTYQENALVSKEVHIIIIESIEIQGNLTLQRSTPDKQSNSPAAQPKAPLNPAVVDAPAAGTLAITGNLLVVDGTLNTNGGTIAFTGSGLQTITGFYTFDKLTVANTAATPDDAHDVDPDQPVTVRELLTVSDGQFQPPACSDFASVTIGADGILKPDGTGCGSSITVSGNWTNQHTDEPNSGFVFAGGTVVLDGSAPQTLSGTTVFNNLTVDNLAGISATGAMSVTGTLDLNQGNLALPDGATIHNVVVEPAGSLSLPSGSTVTVTGNWTDQHSEHPSAGFSSDGGTVVFGGSGTQTFSGETVFGNLSVAAGSSLQLAGGANLGLTGNLQVDPAGSFDATTNPGTTLSVLGDGTPVQNITSGVSLDNLVLGSGAVLAGPAVLNIEGNWTNNGGSLETPVTGSVVFNGSGAQNIGGTAPTTFNNLVINNSSSSTPPAVVTTTTPPVVGGTLTIQDGILTPSSGIDLNNVVIQSGGTLEPVAGSTINVGGDFTNNGTYTPNSGTVVFDGTAPQNVGGTTSPLVFYNMTINTTANPASSGGVVLQEPVTVEQTVTVTNGPLVQVQTSSQFNDMNIGPTGSVTLAPGAAIQVLGTYTKDPAGTFNANGGILAPNNIKLTGTDAQAPQTIKVLEHSAVGTLVASLETIDLDYLPGDTFTYTLVSGTGSTGNANFQIDGDKLRTAIVVNYETARSHSVRIKTTDKDNLTLEKVFTIEIIDINEAPTFTESNPLAMTIDEDNSPTAFALTLNATDIDRDALGQDVIYWEIFQQAQHGTATVDTTTPGDSKAITFVPELDWFGQDSFTVKITDRREGTPRGGSAELVVNLTVNSRNDAPLMTAAPVVGAPNLVQIGSRLTVTSGSWNDNKDKVPGSMTITYQWQVTEQADAVTGTDLVDAVHNEYIVTPAEQGRYLRVIVTATDNGSGEPAHMSTSYTSSWVAVDGHAPASLTLSQTSVLAGTKSGSTIGSLSMTDQDPLDTAAYSLVSGTGSDNNAAFHINGSSLTAAVDLGANSETQYLIRVRGTDGGGNFTEEAIVITVVAVQVKVEPGVPSTFEFTTPSSMPGTVTVKISETAINLPVTLAFTPNTDVTSAPEKKVFANYGFDLDAFMDGLQVPEYKFASPVIITITYDPVLMKGVFIKTLDLRVWVPAATDQKGPSSGTWEVASCGQAVLLPNISAIQVPVCRTGQFAVFGVQKFDFYVPSVNR